MTDLPKSLYRVTFVYDDETETCRPKCGWMGNEPDYDDVTSEVCKLPFVEWVETPGLTTEVTCNVDLNLWSLETMDNIIREKLMIVPEPRYPDEEEDDEE